MFTEEFDNRCRIILATMNKLRLFGVILLFIIILVGARAIWTITFMELDQPHISQGQLDLQSEQLPNKRTIALDGEWAFYPSAWMFDPMRSNPSSKSLTHQHLPLQQRYIQVPHSWNAALHTSNGTSYGYGTYQLRIQVTPGDDTRYSIRIPSVRSASQLYVNGRLLTQSGQPADTVDRYTAHNVPIHAAFHADDQGIIDIIIQAANYEDPRGGGVIRSVRFGTEENIRRETLISGAMQVLIAIFIIMHAIYALILYFLGSRDKKLLYAALSMFMITFNILLSTEDKVLQHILPISYAWSFKLMAAGFIITIYFILKSLQHMRVLPLLWNTRILPVYCWVCIAFALFMLVASVQQILIWNDVFGIIFVPFFVIIVILLIRSLRRGNKDNLFIVLAFIALANHYGWFSVYLLNGIKVLYYPFDLIIALIASSSIWFKGYFKTLTEARELAVQLQHRNAYMDDFLASTSHELRNPLHAILNVSYAVLERERPSMQLTSVKELELLQSVGRRMSFMLNDLMDAVRLKERNIVLQTDNVRLQPIVASTIELVRYLTEGRQLKLTSLIPPTFPPVVADENRVTQIVFNLLHNAVKFTEQGEIIIQAESRSGRAFISVRDTGVGMTEQTMQRIFEPYEQGDRELGNSFGGFGLGLSVSKELVELHGGNLEVHSAPGEGTTFTFSFAMANKAVPAQSTYAEVASGLVLTPEASVDQPSSAANVAAVDRPRILAIDDEPINLRVLSSILTTEQYHVCAVQSGQEALARVEDMEWDLIISDVMMPQMSGYELTRKIRERYTMTELPILLLTARGQPENTAYGFQCGANDYVTKPVDAIELRARVQALTEVGRSTREMLRVESAWLQAQIEPHFLFNTLNAITALSTFDAARTRELLEAFGSFLQQKYRFQNADELVPLEYELELIQSYLFIEKQRFEDRIQVIWDVDDEIELMIPPLTIQPLIENALKHGILKQARGGTITLRIQDRGEYAAITVSDDGVGIQPEVMDQLFERNPEQHQGIALRNVELRLKRLYGQGLRIESELGAGTTISFHACKHPTD